VRRTRVLVDTGPLVALFDRHDRHHVPVLAAWRELRGPVETVWPVVTEAFHLLAFSVPACEALFDLLQTRAMQILDLTDADVPRVRELMAKYADLPMDLADACLIRVGERERIRVVFTIDRRGFSAFAPKHVRRFTLLPRTR
jgi:uncharacterized protein